MTLSFSSYSHKLLTLTLVISIIPILIFGGLYYFDQINHDLETKKNLLALSSDDKSEHISDWLQKRKLNVQEIAFNSIVISETKKLFDVNINEHELFEAKFSIERQLDVAHQNHAWLKDLRISHPETGEVLFYTGFTSPKYNMKYQNHFLEASKGKTTSSEIYPSVEIIENEFGIFEKGVPTLLISSPIQGEVGIEAILTARIDVFELETLFDHHEFENFVSIDRYLLNSNGFLLTKPNSFLKLWNLNSFDKRPELELSLNKNFFEDSFLLTEKNEIGWNEEFKNFLGINVVAVSVPVEGTNWHLMTEIHRSEAYYDTSFFQAILLSLIGITLLSVSGISLFFSSKLTLPIRNLIKVSNQIKKGNLNVNVKTCGSDEIHELAVSFNSMAQSLQKFKESKQSVLKKYHDLYENSPVLHRTINMDGVVTNCNKSFADAFGYSKYEIIGKSVYDFVPLDHKELLDESFLEWKKTGNVQNREIIFKKKDNTTFPALLSANNLYDEKGNRIGSNTTIVDISDVRQKENEIEDLKQKRLSAIGELTARIAHDMRNPLSVIKNSADIIKMSQDNLSEHNQENWERLERGIFRIKHQVEDVLDYVKTSPLKKQPSNLSLILQDALERIEIPPNVSISFPTEKVEVLCDPEKIETVFVNLMMNSIQAMDKKSGTISITIKEISLDYIKIIIEDSGPGIPPHLIPKIFDPLFTTRQIGTGLGLPSCKNIIDNHGGSIEVSSPPGKGAIFEIVLPIRSEWDQLTPEENEKSIQDS